MSNDIRSESKRTTVWTPWEQSEHEVGTTETRHSLSGDGIRSHTEEHLQVLNCGCLAQPVGCCSVCSHLCCQNCFARCANPACGRSLGPCCGRRLPLPGGTLQIFCPSCRGTARRKLLLRLLVSPFVRFKDQP